MTRLSLRRTVVSLLATAAAFAGTATLAPAAPAQAAPAQAAADDRCSFVQFVSSGYSMAVEGASIYDGARIVQQPYYGYGDEFQWCIGKLDAVKVVLWNKHSGKCLTTDGVAGNALTQEQCDYRWDQQWRIRTDSANGAMRIRSDRRPLTVEVYGDSHTPGGVIDAWYANGAANQAVRIS